MTIASETLKNRHLGNGSATSFAYGFKIFNAEDLKVVVADEDDNQTTLTYNTHYTVSGVGDNGGGSITTLDLTSITGSTELPSGWSITLVRDISITQDTDLVNGGTYYASTQEDALDYLTMVAQQLQEQINRSPQVSLTSGVTGGLYLYLITTSVQTASNAASAAAASATSASTSETNAATSANSASTSAASAFASELIAQAWASEAEDTTVSGTSYSALHYASKAQAWASEAEDTTVSGTSYSALHYAAKAEGYTNDIIPHTFEQTASVSQSTIDISSESWILAQSVDNIGVFIDGDKIPTSKITRSTDTILTLDDALVGGELIELKSVAFNASATSEAAASAASAAISATSASNAAASIPQNNATGTAPTVNDDELSGYSRFSLWADTASGVEYICTDPSAGNAQWSTIGISGATAPILTSTDPTILLDSYDVGQILVNTVSRKTWICYSSVSGASYWSGLDHDGTTQIVVLAEQTAATGNYTTGVWSTQSVASTNMYETEIEDDYNLFSLGGRFEPEIDTDYEVTMFQVWQASPAWYSTSSIWLSVWENGVENTNSTIEFYDVTSYYDASDRPNITYNKIISMVSSSYYELYLKHNGVGDKTRQGDQKTETLSIKSV